MSHADIHSILFDQEEITRIHEASQAREFAKRVDEEVAKRVDEEVANIVAERVAETVAETTKKDALEVAGRTIDRGGYPFEVAGRMIDRGGYPLEDIAYISGLPLDEVERLAAD